MNASVNLNAELLEAFAGIFLSPLYDEPKPTPGFHREGWDLYCSTAPQAAIAAPREHAKAQPLTTPILTPTGWKPLGELSEGDRVVGSNGKPVVITHLHPISMLPCYQVTLADGRSTVCSDEHIWPIISAWHSNPKFPVMRSLKSMFGKYKGTRLDKRTETEYFEYRYYIPMHAPIEFYPHKDLTFSHLIDPYMLGVWLGDGHSSDGRITSADPEIFSYFPDKNIESKRSSPYLYTVSGLRENLSLLGLLNNKHIPESFFTSPIPTRIALLQGLMDTDGTIQEVGWNAYFCNTNKKLVDGVIDIVRSLGGTANMLDDSYKLHGEPYEAWRISIDLPQSLCPFKLSRKATLWKGRSNLKLAITNIEQVDSQPSRCITVNALDGCYVTENYIRTHNSTAFTHDFVLANVLFRVEQYVVIVSSNEEMAIEHLTDISKELRDNEDLIAEFGIRRFVSDAKTDIIIEMDDGYQFRIIARGSGQKMRGRKWMGKRPGLILCDDLEDDEQVESLERRIKFRRWFFRALKPALRDGGRLRLHGTVLHEDALLARLMKDSTWATLFYRAHASFDDFSNILWQEKFPVSRLKAIRSSFIAQFDAAGYAQEYLNDPFDHSDSYLQRGDFVSMEDEDYNSPQVFYAAMDIAASKKDRANRTSITIGGKNIKNFLLFRDQRVGRWSPIEWLEVVFDVYKQWRPQAIFVEKGQIWASVEAFIQKEMLARQLWINFVPINPAKDKATRGRSLQKRMRGGGCRFDKRADWYVGFEEELLHFTEDAEALLDDQFDSAALLSWGLDSFAEEEEEDFYTEEERAFLSEQARRAKTSGRSEVTGY